MLTTIGRIADELEAARLANSAPQMRAAIDGLQNALGMLREATAACAGDADQSGEHSGHTVPERAMPALPPSPPGSVEGHQSTHGTGAASAGSVIRVTVAVSGFEPASLNLTAGTEARVTFVRVSERTCGTEVVIPEFGIRRALPLNEPVLATFTPTRSGQFAFTCGMNMLKGLLVVR